MDDKDCYQKIGQLLYNISPDGAKKIIMRASLAQEGDVGTFEYDYVDKSGSTSWFVGGGKANSEMVKILAILRASYIAKGEPAWNGCEFVVDVEKGDFKITFKY